MLTPQETQNTREELQENYRWLNPDRQQMLNDLQISNEDLSRVLEMNHPNPGYVWEVRDYLEDKLTEKGIAVYPFTKLADHRANHWFPYDTPWRK